MQLLTNLFLSLLAAIGITLAPQPIAPPTVEQVVAAPTPPSQITPDGKRTLSFKDSGESTIILVDDQPVLTFPDYISSLVIPFNTWSPDNKYFFIKHNEDYLVMVKSGELVSVTDAFYEAYPDFTISDVTGWASPTLLIVNTPEASFWFDITTRKFIKLSTYFE